MLKGWGKLLGPICLVVFLSPTLYAYFHLDWNASSDIDFSIQYTLNPDTGEKRALLRYRRISFDGKYGPWSYAGHDSWQNWTTPQKCRLFRTLKELDSSLIISGDDCKGFIKYFEEIIRPNDYISLDILMIGKLSGLITAFENGDFKMDSTELVGRCGSGTNQQTISSLGDVQFVPSFPKKRYFKKLTRPTTCRYINWEKYRKNYKEGLKGQFTIFRRGSLNKITKGINKFFNLFIQKVHAFDDLFEDDEKEKLNLTTLVSEKLNTEKGVGLDDIIQKFLEHQQLSVSLQTNEASQMANTCSDGSCNAKAMEPFVTSLEECNKELDHDYQNAIAQLENRYEEQGGDPEELNKAKEVLQEKYHQMQDEYKEINSGILEAQRTGSFEKIKKITKDNEEKTIEAELEWSKSLILEHLDLEKEKEKIQLKKDKGLKLNQQEKETLNKDLVVKREVLNALDGSTSIESTKRADFFDLDETVKFGSKEDNFDSAVVDFSHIKAGSDERFEAVSSRLLLEAQRRNIDLSIESANRMAKKNLNEKDLIINFDNIFSKGTANPVSDAETDFLKKTLSTNKDSAREELVKETLKLDNLDEDTARKLREELSRVSERRSLKEQYVQNALKANPNLGDIFAPKRTPKPKAVGKKAGRKEIKETPVKSSGSISRQSKSNNHVRGTSRRASSNFNRSNSTSQSFSPESKKEKLHFYKKILDLTQKKNQGKDSSQTIKASFSNQEKINKNPSAMNDKKAKTIQEPPPKDRSEKEVKDALDNTSPSSLSDSEYSAPGESTGGSGSNQSGKKGESNARGPASTGTPETASDDESTEDIKEEQEDEISFDEKYKKMITKTLKQCLKEVDRKEIVKAVKKNFKKEGDDLIIFNGFFKQEPDIIKCAFSAAIYQSRFKKEVIIKKQGTLRGDILKFDESVKFEGKKSNGLVSHLAESGLLYPLNQMVRQSWSH